MNGGLAVYVPIVLAIGAVVCYFVARVLPSGSRRWTGTFAALWLLASAGILLAAGAGPSGQSPFAPILVPSPIGLVLGLLATVLGAAAAIGSQGRIDPDGPVQLYYPLLLFALAGAVAVGFAGDIFALFVAVELSAIPSYALIAYDFRKDPAALPAAVKYLIQGVVGTITALLGVSLLYLGSHTLSIAALPAALARADPALISLAAVLILFGYGVKLAIVPMHTWLPDAYSRAPAGVTAILVGATKAGVFVALFLTISTIPKGAVAPALLGAVISLFAVVTMTAGNVLALAQTDLRRVLAYSSVAQMGYILLGIGIGMQYGLVVGILAGLFYLVAYGVMKAGAFIAADALAHAAGSSDLVRMRGIGARYPLAGVALAIFVLGLIGVPATAGFLAKLLVFQAGMATLAPMGVMLVLILAANSAVSLGYYAPILSNLLFGGHGADPAAASRGIAPATTVAIVALAAATVLLGLFPQTVFAWIEAAASQIFVWGAT